MKFNLESYPQRYVEDRLQLSFAEHDVMQADAVPLAHTELAFLEYEEVIELQRQHLAEQADTEMSALLPQHSSALGQLAAMRTSGAMLRVASKTQRRERRLDRAEQRYMRIGKDLVDNTIAVPDDAQLNDGLFHWRIPHSQWRVTFDAGLDGELDMELEHKSFSPSREFRIRIEAAYDRHYSLLHDGSCTVEETRYIETRAGTVSSEQEYTIKDLAMDTNRAPRRAFMNALGWLAFYAREHGA